MFSDLNRNHAVWAGIADVAKEDTSLCAVQASRSPNVFERSQKILSVERLPVPKVYFDKREKKNHGCTSCFKKADRRSCIIGRKYGSWIYIIDRRGRQSCAFNRWVIFNLNVLVLNHVLADLKLHQTTAFFIKPRIIQITRSFTSLRTLDGLDERGEKEIECYHLTGLFLGHRRWCSVIAAKNLSKNKLNRAMARNSVHSKLYWIS